jgi:hypothetical protein
MYIMRKGRKNKAIYKTHKRRRIYKNKRISKTRKSTKRYMKGG